MRKILFSLLLAVLGAFAASGAGERDVTLAEGQTLQFYPARALLTLPTEEIMLQVCEQIIKSNLSVRQTEKLCKKLTAEKKPPKHTEKVPNY